MRIGHETTVSTYIGCVQVIKVIGSIGLCKCLRMPPDPFFIRYIVESFVFGSRCHQRISLTGSGGCLCCLLPLSGQQIGTGKQSIDNIGIRLEFLPIPFAGIVLQITLCQVKIIKNALIHLGYSRFCFRRRFTCSGFCINRYTGSSGIFQVSELIVLRQMKVTKRPQSKCLSFCLKKFFRITINSNGGVTVINRFINEIPGKRGSAIVRYCYIIELIR